VGSGVGDSVHLGTWGRPPPWPAPDTASVAAAVTVCVPLPAAVTDPASLPVAVPLRSSARAGAGPVGEVSPDDLLDAAAAAWSAHRVAPGIAGTLGGGDGIRY